VLGVSERQCYGLNARVKDQGVLHGNRGRPCKYKVGIRLSSGYGIVELAQKKVPRGLMIITH
jgi:hypothetical protein